MNNAIKDLRIFLRNEIYDTYIQELIDIIKSELDPFSAVYDSSSKIVTIKVKKTNMKRNSHYEHTSHFYYNIMNGIMYDFISSHNSEIKKSNNDTSIIDSDIYMLYSITAIGDNIVNIIL